MRVALRTNVASEEREPRAMSPRMQRQFDRTALRFCAPGTLPSIAAPRIVPKLSARVIINDREFDSLLQMPAEYRRFYEELLARALPVQRAVQIVAQTERANFIKRTTTLAFIAAACAAVIVYLLLHGYYA